MGKSIRSVCEMSKQLLGVLNGAQKKKIIVVTIIILIGAVFETLGISAIIPFIQALIAPENLMTNKYILPLIDVFNIQSNIGLIIAIGIIIIVIYVVKNIYLLQSSIVQIKFRCRFQKDLSGKMLEAYMNRPYSFFLDTNSSDIMRGINGDVDSIYMMLDNIFRILVETLTVIFVGTFIICTDPIMALGVIFLALLCLVGITLGIRNKLKWMGEEVRKANAKQFQYAYQAITGIKEIKVMQRTDTFVKSYNEAYEEKRKQNVGYSCIISYPERIIEATCVGGLIGIVCIRILIGVDTSTFIPQLAAFAVAAFRILPSISRLTGYISGLVFYRPALEATYNHLKIIETESEQRKLNENENVHVNIESKLKIENIQWMYPNSKKYILDNVNIEIEKGQAIAFIGESGAGKTTLADIILGLFEPIKGEVKIDGINIFTIPKLWSKLVGYVPQNVYLLDDTIKNNILFGSHEEEDSDNKVWKALEQAQLKDFVKNLPNGLDTIVGERGIKFSGGQRQRIAIARALYYDPEILVLDEATSALDGKTEDAVMDAIEKLQGKKTLIIVAHRLSTIKHCDKVYEIKDGRAYLKNE